MLYLVTLDVLKMVILRTLQVMLLRIVGSYGKMVLVVLRGLVGLMGIKNI